MKRMFLLTASLVVLTVPLLAWGQAANVEMASRIAQARQQNAMMIQQYTWNSRTELIKDGNVKDLHLDLVSYGPGGQLQRTVLNDQGAQVPRGFLRRAIAENEKQQMEQYLSGLRQLLDQYTLPTTGKILDFINQGNIMPADGMLQLSGNNVVNPGDSLTMWVDSTTFQVRRIQVQSTYQGDAVTANASYKTLSGGPTYMQYGEVEVPAKNMSLQVHNFDYQRNN